MADKEEKSAFYTRYPYAPFMIGKLWGSELWSNEICSGDRSHSQLEYIRA